MATKTYAPQEEKSNSGVVGLLGLFGLLALVFFAKKKPSANLRLDSLVINPTEVFPNDKVTIQVNATNIGTTPGPAIVSFYDGTNLLERRTVELGPGGNVLVAIEIYPATLGVHNIKVDPGSLTDSFEVITPPVPPQTPVTVGLYGAGTEMPKRYNFVSNTTPRRYFEFYTQGGNLYFMSSRDPWWVTTLTRGQVVASLGSLPWGIFYNPTTNHIHMVYGTYYQRGTPDGFGAIVWDPVQTPTPSGIASVSCDSSDHPFVSAGSTVYKSKTADGTWVEHTEMGFPRTFVTPSGVNFSWAGKIMQLLGDKMAFVYLQMQSHYSACYSLIRIYSYDGAGNWNTGARSPLYVGSPGGMGVFSAVSMGDSVHLIYNDSFIGHVYQGECYSVTNDYPGIHYVEYQYAPNAIVGAKDLAIVSHFANISIDDYGEKYVFWLNGADIQLAFTRGGIWQPVITVVRADPDAGTGGLRYLHVPANQYHQDIVIFYSASGLLKFFPLPNLLGV